VSRLVLAFDTSTEVCALALGRRHDGGEVALLAAEDFEAPRAAMSRLLPAVASVLRGMGLSLREVDEVVVGRGPGSFTGVRIGVATAKGIAQGLGAPLFGVGTLDAVAWSFPEFDGVLGVVGDAMRGEVYPALFRLDAGHPVRLGPDRVEHPGRVAEEWAALAGPLLLTGNGLAKHQAVFSAALGRRATFTAAERGRVSGHGLLLAYAAALTAGEQGTGNIGSLLPIYTRLSDAEQAEQEGQGRARDTTPASGVHGPGGRAGAGHDDASV